MLTTSSTGTTKQAQDPRTSREIKCIAYSKLRIVPPRLQWSFQPQEQIGVFFAHDLPHH
ncbi:Uncharacterised protein [Vibrio cholerae]|nr:Uncharacterised protein [Vibrio cholerae]